MVMNKISANPPVTPYPEGSVVKILVEDNKSPLRKEDFGVITDASVGYDGGHLYTVEPENPDHFASWAYQHSDVELHQPAYVNLPSPPVGKSLNFSHVSANEMQPPIMPTAVQEVSKENEHKPSMK